MYSLLEILPLATKGVEVQPTMQNLAPKLTHLRVSIDVGPPTASYTMSTPLPRKKKVLCIFTTVSSKGQQQCGLRGHFQSCPK